MGHRRGAQHQLQHPRRAAGLLAGRGGRRVPPLGRGRAGDRPVSRRAASRLPGSRERSARSTRVTPGMSGLGPVRGAARRACRCLVADDRRTARLAAETTGGMLREQLKSMQFWSLEACVILGLALGAVVARDRFKRLSRRDRLRMAGLSALALGAHAVRRAAHEPHLLRRADLPEHRPEPRRPEAGADVQRRHGRVRPAAVLERRVQQAAVRLPAPAEPGLPGRSASGRPRRSRSTRP